MTVAPPTSTSPSAPASEPGSANASEALGTLAHDHWEGVLRRNPTLATFYGDFRYNDQLENAGPEGRDEEAGALRGTLDRLAAIPLDALAADERVTWDMLRIASEAGLDAIRLRLDEMAVDQMGGPQVWLQELLNWHPTDSAEHVDQLIARFETFGTRYLPDYLANLRDGVRDGRTAPGMAVERVVGQLRATLDTPVEQSPLVQVKAKVGDLAPGQVERLQAVVRDTVYPAYAEMLRYLSGEYLGYARTDPGVWSVTGGAEIYAMLCRQHTTTDLSPDALHQVGIDDLASIHAEMREIMGRRGARAETSIRAFTESLTADPSNLPASREEIVAEAERYLALAYEALPGAFGHLPKTRCIVKPIEEFREKDSVAAFYYQPSEEGSRPGIFYVNTFEPSSRPRHSLPALVYHEGVPGHHLQIAIAQEASNLPSIRRFSAGWLANAYVEGWALYTERLADELGLYPDDLARFGMLGYQAWRACRLIVDTGLHHLRWSRQQSIDWFSDNVGLTERETVNEVDRYIIWPGQALSYKVGQREIESIRRQAQSRLGARFSLPAFHDEVLRHGPVPLSTLRLTLEGWIAEQKNT